MHSHRFSQFHPQPQNVIFTFAARILLLVATQRPDDAMSTKNADVIDVKISVLGSRSLSCREILLSHHHVAILFEGPCCQSGVPGSL